MFVEASGKGTFLFEIYIRFLFMILCALSNLFVTLKGYISSKALALKKTVNLAVFSMRFEPNRLIQPVSHSWASFSMYGKS